MPLMAWNVGLGSMLIKGTSIFVFSALARVVQDPVLFNDRNSLRPPISL